MTDGPYYPVVSELGLEYIKHHSAKGNNDRILNHPNVKVEDNTGSYKDVRYCVNNNIENCSYRKGEGEECVCNSLNDKPSCPKGSSIEGKV